MRGDVAGAHRLLHDVLQLASRCAGALHTQPVYGVHIHTVQEHPPCSKPREAYAPYDITASARSASSTCRLCCAMRAARRTLQALLSVYKGLINSKKLHV